MQRVSRKMSTTREKPQASFKLSFFSSATLITEKKDDTIEIDEEGIEVDYPFSTNPYSADRYHDFFVGWLIENNHHRNDT